jgi:hypothetical protein
VSDDFDYRRRCSEHWPKNGVGMIHAEPKCCAQCILNDQLFCPSCGDILGAPDELLAGMEFRGCLNPECEQRWSGGAYW